MSVGPLNLLPDEVIQEFHHTEIDRQKKYYLSAIALTLCVFTFLGVSIRFFYAHALKEAEELLLYSDQRLEQLNPVWDDVLALNSAVDQIAPIRDDGERLLGLFDILGNSFGTVRVLGIKRKDASNYTLTMQSTNVEDSSLFVAELQKLLIPDAVVQLETIQEREDEVRFTVSVSYAKQIQDIYERK